MNPKELEQARKLFEELNKKLDELNFLMSFPVNCLTCCEWNLQLDKCNKYNAVPPPKIIISGCPEYYGVPF